MADDLSFSAQVKEELAHMNPAQQCCRLMELAALLRAIGSITLGGEHRLSCSVTTDHAAVARKIIRYVKAEFALHTEVMVMRRQRLRKNLSYLVRIPSQPGVMEMLQRTGVVDLQGRFHEWRDLATLENDHCRRAYLRGTFLGTGWVSAPERQHHLEMTTIATEAADALGQMLFHYGIAVRVAARKQSLVLYIKDADQIALFLNLIGAHHSLLRYEDVRVMKEMRNRVNRQVNAETANLDKTVEAAARQVDGLERLRVTGGLDRVSAPLRELALLRLKNPDASLKELGEMCVPPVGKSGINHRMRQLMKEAESLLN